MTKNKIVYKWFRDNQCYQSYMTLEILIPGQDHTLKGKVGKNLYGQKFDIFV